MKRTKRKYTRRKIIQPPISNGEMLKSSGIGGESGIILPTEDIKPSKTPFTFKDLPLSLRMQVESAIRMRKRLGLFDDSKERKEKAIRNFRGDRPR